MDIVTARSAANANELGVYRRLCGWVQGFPAVDTPWPVGRIAQVREFDPAFRLLLAVNVWKSPNDGLIKTQAYMIGREVKSPLRSKEWIRGALLSPYPIAGIRYTRFIMPATILDGLTTEERNLGQLPKFMPFTQGVVESLRKALWKVRNQSQEQEELEEARAEQKRKQQKAKSDAAELESARRENSLRARIQAGKAARVFMSDTLHQLRQASNMEVV
jgi:hypothetical protein